MVNVEGYLLGDSRWTSQLKEEYAAYFQLIDDVRQYTHSLITQLEMNSSDGQEIISASLFIRVVELFEASILLIGKGLLNPAKIEVRSLLEYTISLDLIAKDRKWMERFARSEAYDKYVTYKKIMDNPLSFKGVTSEQFAEAEAEVNRLNESDVNKLKWPKLWRLAKLAGYKEIYDTAYFLFSDAVHPTTASCRELLTVDQNSKVKHINWGPTDKDADKLLFTSIDLFCRGACSIEKLFAVEQPKGAELISKAESLFDVGLVR